jgi:predicted RNase H-like nuclease (RuvC/YqgF family)
MDSKGYKAISYDKLTAVLVEAVKELKAEKAETGEIKTLKAENQQLKDRLLQQQSQIDELRSLIAEMKG